MKRALVWLILGMTELVFAPLLLAAESPTGEVADGSDEGADGEKDLDDWDLDGAEDDFSALFEESHGIGVGLVSASLPGWSVYYDYNQSHWVFEDKRAQFHYQLSRVGDTVNDANKQKVARAWQTQLTASARLLNVQGVFVGAGLGVQETSLKYIPTGMDHNASSLFGIFEGGWQGDDGFYFQIGIRPAFHITKSPTVNTSLIPEDNGHKKAMSRLWRWSQELSGFMLGFGWYVS